jgi:hypothetical protein
MSFKKTVGKILSSGAKKVSKFASKMENGETNWVDKAADKVMDAARVVKEPIKKVVNVTASTIAGWSDKKVDDDGTVKAEPTIHECPKCKDMTAVRVGTVLICVNCCREEKKDKK